LDHIELQHVIFVRVNGMRRSEKWIGKIWWIKPPLSLIPYYLVENMVDTKLLLPNTIINLKDKDLLDIRYIIAINDNGIKNVSGDIETLELITLIHELKHIKIGMTGLAEHDSKDFKFVLNEFGVYWNEGLFVADSIGHIDELE